MSEMRQHRSHFDTFGDAVLTLFIICTGENTYSVGWDLIQASGTTWAVVYVAVWSLVSTSLLALVLGVLIEAAAQPVLMSENLDGIAAEIGEDERMRSWTSTSTASRCERMRPPCRARRRR